MTTQHTPGPWRVCAAGRDGFSLWEVNTVDGKVIGDVRTEKDARLIAAAPDLLAALQAFRNGYTIKAMDLARTAIAKATGGAS